MIYKLNRKGNAFIGVLLVVALILIVLWLIFIKPIQDEKKQCEAKLNEISKIYNKTKERCNLEIQKLIKENTELKENNTNLILQLERYEKLSIPFTKIEINNWLGVILLSISLIILLAVANLKIKIERIESNFLKVIIGLLIILNILFLSLKVYSLIIILFF